MGKLLAAGAAAVVFLTGALLAVAALFTLNPAQGQPGAVCTTTGPVQGLDAQAAANARTLYAVANRRGGQPAAVITITVGLAESNLKVLNNPNDPPSMAFPAQGTGHDHTSSGIFQQQNNGAWGTPAQRMDPAASTNLFLDSLLKVSGWNTMPPQQAAQRVQQSFDPTGSNYLVQLAQARNIVASITHTTETTTCTGGGTGQPPGPPGANGLPAAYRVPGGTSIPAQTAIHTALAQLGKPYVFGATGPSAFDCSGLMLVAWRAAGVTLPRTTFEQANSGSAVNASTLSPGDLVLTAGSDGTNTNPGHVGMFLGSGLVVEAPYTGKNVRVVPYTAFTGGAVPLLRHIA